jgi:homoserine kinase
VGADLPLETERNVAGVAGLALLDVETDFGFDIEIYKKYKAGGIGSSAASAAGAVYGINALLGNPFETKDLVQFAMQGENWLVATPMLTMLPCPFGWIYVSEKLQPIRY